MGVDELWKFHHGTFDAVCDNFAAALGRGSPFHSLEIVMRHLLLLALLLSTANVSAAASFAERVAIAKETESQKEASGYFFGSFFPAISPSMGGIMKMCLSRSGASKKMFDLVANIALSGELIDIDYEPKSNNTGACCAKEFATLKAPPPPLCDCGVLPVTINMKVEP